MQAIQTTILPATDTKPYRIKAKCARGSLTLGIGCLSWSCDDVRTHRYVADALRAKFIKEDLKAYGPESVPGNPWSKPYTSGSLPNGDYVHVCADSFLVQTVVQFADEDDLKAFDRFIAEAKKRDGTPAPLQCGLVASALKRANGQPLEQVYTRGVAVAS